jgi:hypothetical protein
MKRRDVYKLSKDEDFVIRVCWESNIFAQLFDEWCKPTSYGLQL